MQWWGRYIGLPFEDCHCWALVAKIYREQLGVDLPSYGEISSSQLLRIARQMETGKDEPCWLPVTEPKAFDVVLMRVKTAVCHVGLATDSKHMLHTESGKDAVRVALRSPLIAGRIVGFRRYAA